MRRLAAFSTVWEGLGASGWFKAEGRFEACLSPHRTVHGNRRPWRSGGI